MAGASEKAVQGLGVLGVEGRYYQHVREHLLTHPSHRNPGSCQTFRPPRWGSWRAPHECQCGGVKISVKLLPQLCSPNKALQPPQICCMHCNRNLLSHLKEEMHLIAGREEGSRRQKLALGRPQTRNTFYSSSIPPLHLGRPPAGRLAGASFLSEPQRCGFLHDSYTLSLKLPDYS